MTLAAASMAACSKPQPAETDTPDTTATEAPADAAPVAYASLTGDAAKGETLFLQCKICHSVEAGKNMVGPSLHGIVGRPAGQVVGYNYSPANKASGLTWSEEELYLYLENPRKTVPGTKMAYSGIKRPQDRADLVTYLKTATN